MSETGSQTYTIDQTRDAGPAAEYTLHETGARTFSGSQTGSTNTGAYSRSETGSDAYTLTQTGTLNLLVYTETLTAQDSYTLAETGNTSHGGFNRTLTGTGSGTLELSGTENGIPIASTTAVGPNFTLTESGHYASGSITRTETGLDRYGLLQQFDLHADGNGQPGVVDYSPIGAVYFVGQTSAGPTAGGSFTPRQSPSAAQQDPFAKQALDLLHEYCFAAGTLVLTNEGPRAIETLQPGDLVLSVPDTDPEAEPTWQPLAQVYHNAPARLLNVHVGDLVIRTTHNHPFYVKAKGWAAAEQVEIGDELRTADGCWTPVTDLFDNGDVEPLFNLRVEGTRTYFVADPGNAFAVLVHNESPQESPESVGALSRDGSARMISSKIDPWVDEQRRRNSIIPIAIGDHDETEYPNFPTYRDYVSADLVPFVGRDRGPEIAGTDVAELKRSGELTMRARPGQRTVYTFDGTRRAAIVPTEWGYRVAEDSPLSHNPQALADLAVHDRVEIEDRKNIAGSLTTVLHVVPFGAASDYFSTEGIRSKEAWISVAGDGAAFLTCGGTKALRITGMAIEGGVISFRGYEAVRDVQKGDGWSATAKGAEIVLRATMLRGAFKGFNELPVGVRAELLDEAGNFSFRRMLKDLHENQEGAVDPFTFLVRNQADPPTSTTTSRLSDAFDDLRRSEPFQERAGSDSDPA